MITIKDFDEIVTDNPFLTNGNTGYGIRKLFWYFVIMYNLDSLSCYGQSSSTCKYITMDNELTKVTYKIIREYDYIKIEEIFPNYDREIVTDPKKLSKVEKKFNDLKKIVKKQIEKHKEILNRLENLKVKFDFDTTKEFLEVLYPKMTSIQQEKIIKKLAKIEKKPMSYFSEPTDTIGANPNTILKSLFFDVLVDELEKYGALIVVDWKSPYEEVVGLIIPVFKKLGIEIDERLKKKDNYGAENFLISINNILSKKDYMIISFSGVSDTFLLGFTTEKDYKKLDTYSKKINIEVRKWEK